MISQQQNPHFPHEECLWQTPGRAAGGTCLWLSTEITWTEQPQVMAQLCTEQDLPAEERAHSWCTQKILPGISSPCTTADMLWSYTNVNSPGRKMAQKNRTQLFSMRKLKFSSKVKWPQLMFIALNVFLWKVKPACTWFLQYQLQHP